MRTVERYGDDDSKQQSRPRHKPRARRAAGGWVGFVDVCVVVLVNDAVPFASPQQPAVDGERGGADDDEGEGKAAPERHAGDSGIHGLMVIEIVSAANAIGATAASGMPERSSGRLVSE